MVKSESDIIDTIHTGRSLLTRTAHSILYVGKTVSKSPNILPLAVVRLAI